MLCSMHMIPACNAAVLMYTKHSDHISKLPKLYLDSHIKSDYFLLHAHTQTQTPQPRGKLQNTSPSIPSKLFTTPIPPGWKRKAPQESTLLKYFL